MPDRLALKMLMQTNSYVVPKDRRTEHARLVVRFRQTMLRLGCEHFEVYEQVGANWAAAEATGRFVQIMRFRDRRHQQQVQAAEQADPDAQQLIREFCELVNLPYQQQQGLFAMGYYASVTPTTPAPRLPGSSVPPPNGAVEPGHEGEPDAFSAHVADPIAAGRRQVASPKEVRAEMGSLDDDDLVGEDDHPPAGPPEPSRT